MAFFFGLNKLALINETYLLLFSALKQSKSLQKGFKLNPLN